MNPSTDPVPRLITEVCSTFETETTISRILGRTKEALERFLANPASLDQVKESLARVLSRKAIPYGQPVDQEVTVLGNSIRTRIIFSAFALHTSAPQPAASHTIMASSSGRFMESCQARRSSRFTSAWTMAANRIELHCVRYHRSVNVREKS